MARYSYDDRTPGRRYYEAVSEKPVTDYYGDEAFPVAQVVVEKPEEIPLYYPKLERAGFHQNRIYDEIRIAGGGLLHPDEVDRLTDQQTETPQMFITRPGLIDSAFSDRSTQVAAGKMLGVIADDFKGHRMMASEDLSRHSSKLVQKALAAGILEPNHHNPSGAVTNTIDFVDRTTYEPFTGTEIPRDRVNFVSRELSRRLDPPPPPAVAEPEPDYEQLKLDGV